MDKAEKPLVVLKDVWKTYIMGEVKVHALKNISVPVTARITNVAVASGVAQDFNEILIEWMF